MEWADATVWAAALQTEGAANDKKLRDTLLHLHGVQRGFLGIWNNRPPTFPKVDDFTDLPSVHRWARPYYAEAMAFLETVDGSRLQEKLRLPWVEGLEKRMGRSLDSPTLAETVYQVASHSMYHRGQVNRSLRRLGGEPPLVDFIAWVWFGKPTAEWDGR